MSRTMSIGQTQSRSGLTHVALIVTGALFMALCAQVSIPLPFSPVPITLQTFGIALIGGVLGSRRGAASLATYLLMGLAGMHVFAQAYGAAAFFLPTSGYLYSFVPGAFVIGWLVERGMRNGFAAFLAILIGEAVIMGSGAAYLSCFVGLQKGFALGFYPFIPGAIIKGLMAVALLPSGHKFLARLGV